MEAPQVVNEQTGVASLLAASTEPNVATGKSLQSGSAKPLEHLKRRNHSSIWFRRWLLFLALATFGLMIYVIVIDGSTAPM